MGDFTCGDTMAVCYIGISNTGPEKVAATVESRKTNYYRHLYDRFIFNLVGVETMGPWGQSAK